MFSAAEVSKQIGCSRSTVHRAAVRLRVGGKVGSQFVFSSADVERLKSAVRREPGNPKMVPGSRYCRQVGRRGGKNKKTQ